MEMEGSLLCCPDKSYLRDEVRDYKTYAPMVGVAGTSEKVLRATFNVGVMLISPGRLGPSTYADLVECVQPASWSEVSTGHTDSVLLNRRFRDTWTQVSERFNYLISKDRGSYTRASVGIDDAVLLHYLGRPKPWEPVAPDVFDTMDPERKTAFQLWRAAWISNRF
jgi:lipopolysaccharide biosynthesis glycosyltransferase